MSDLLDSVLNHIDYMKGTDWQAPTTEAERGALLDTLLALAEKYGLDMEHEPHYDAIVAYRSFIK